MFDSKVYSDGKEGEFHTDTNPEATYTTHYQTRWICRECGDSGIAWVKKGDLLKRCPKCYKNLAKTSTTKIDPKGVIKRIWNSDSRISRLDKYSLKPKRRRVVCGNCGSHNFYYELSPKRCNDCGHKLMEDQ